MVSLIYYVTIPSYEWRRTVTIYSRLFPFFDRNCLHTPSPPPPPLHQQIPSMTAFWSDDAVKKREHFPWPLSVGLSGREEDVHESGLALSLVPISQHPLPDRKRDCWKGPGPGGLWMVYCYIWVPIFSCINVVGFDAIVICHLTLTRFRSSQSSATTCIAREDGPSQSYPHPHGRRRFLDFQFYWGWDIRNEVL